MSDFIRSSRRIVKITFRIMILLFIQLWFSNAYAIFGKSCKELPRSDATGYLNINTAYGYLLQNIDMQPTDPTKSNKLIIDGCLQAQGDDILKFCINNNLSGIACIPVKIKAGNVVKLKDIDSNPNIGGNPLLANLELSVDIIGNSLCLQMLTSRGNMPIVCRDYNATPIGPGPEEEVCKNLGSSCYDGRTKSQSLLSFSGITVHCVRQTLDKVFYTGNGCPQLEEDIHFTYLSPFPTFQESMKLAVRGALILYVMFYGFKVVLNNEYVHLNKIAAFILKFIFVVYFSVGFGNSYNENGRPVSHNGVTETVLPMLLQLTSDFTEIVFLSGGSQGLCNYDPKKYQQGYEFYRVWDAIDCRIGYYLGVQLFYNIGSMFKSLTGSTYSDGDSGSPANFGNPGKDGIGALDQAGAFALFPVMFGFLMAGNIIVVLCGMIFVIIFISVIFYFLSAYLVSMVTLYVMAYISPIFVPMLLFERTKVYFDAWVKVIISCTLQPAVIGGFIALLLTMYDSVFYGNCEYLRHDYEISGISGVNFSTPEISSFNFSTFELREPSSEPEKCINSPGYKLVKYYLGQGWEKKILMFFEISTIKDFADLGLGIIYLMVFTFIFYFALQSINEFVSDLTGGPNMGSVTISPTAIMEKAYSLASKYSSAKAEVGGKGGGVGKGGGGGEGKDGEAPPSEAGASDRASTSGGDEKEGEDKVSTGSAAGGTGGGT